MKRSVSYVTDEGSGHHLGRNKELLTIAEASLTNISPSWRQAVMTSGLINQPWHHKLRQIRKELYK